ncbi:MAG TPA: UDP-N-acetylglucosamine--N-acetylmuramyl-(pentapeptide) pyrophosphoryl-undecaprenol N-acetylglucosamine transferase [Chloroflexota bacterium]|nr:UDP-N-acetylglucosamine--N-acetylmuramyl-(pentapeptide) pyrophosphoryl-undecaprenol N-acetylglucosamine transferase [Chloroflexota bacterium]
MRILLAGGGSGGSATPILAVASELRARVPDVELLYVGTHGGPEADLAAEARIPYVGVATGKLRRYWDSQNITDAGRVVRGIGESLMHVRRFKPDVACGAGGFASVPPLAAAGLSRVPVLIHQQDVIPGLANRLLVPFARRITVALPDTVKAFPRGRTVVRGNPVRRRVTEGRAAEGFKRLGLDPAVPLVLVTGGGTGALGLNRIVAAAAADLVQRAQVVHLTGRGRGVETGDHGPRYQQHEFLVEEMPDLLAAASVVVSRAGMGTLSELAALGKASIVVPMPGSHQEANARAFARGGGTLVFNQETLSPMLLASTVRDLLDDAPRREALGAAIRQVMPLDAASRIADEVISLIGGPLPSQT